MRAVPIDPGRPLSVVLLWAMLATAACEPAAEQELETAAAGVPTSPQDAFWANLRQQCGQAYPGRLVVDRPDRDMLSGDEDLIAHWVECDDARMDIAFHIGRDGGDWDRSRTWVLTRHRHALELRHDHRRRDGSEDEETWYGGLTVDTGSAETQWFLLDERRAPDGSPLGWRLEIRPGERYVYGTIRGEDYTWRVDFDLSSPVATPPAAWGHD